MITKSLSISFFLLLLSMAIAISISISSTIQAGNKFHIRPMLFPFSFHSPGHSIKTVLFSTPANTDCCEVNNTISISPPSNYDPTFIIDITSPEVTLDEIKDENLVKIVNLQTSDEQTNTLVWKCLGYRYNPETKQYSNDLVFPKWKLQYPNPPDLIGVKRIYDPSIDKPVRNANMNLMRSIPRSYKAGVKNLAYVGFKGYKLNELTPNKTRRAQVVNWLIYYREYLFGKTFEQLAQERVQEQKKSEEESNLPSEIMFQKLRLDENPANQS